MGCNLLLVLLATVSYHKSTQCKDLLRRHMKPTASNLSHRDFSQLIRAFDLGKTLEAAYGAGAMTADYRRAPKASGWTAQQLLALSAAKSFYN